MPGSTGKWDERETGNWSPRYNPPPLPCWGRGLRQTEDCNSFYRTGKGWALFLDLHTLGDAHLHTRFSRDPRALFLSVTLASSLRSVLATRSLEGWADGEAPGSPEQRSSPCWAHRLGKILNILQNTKKSEIGLKFTSNALTQLTTVNVFVPINSKVIFNYQCDIILQTVTFVDFIPIN